MTKTFMGKEYGPADPPEIRTQYDNQQEQLTKQGALDCTSSKDMTRQEFKDDADINVILKKFGIDQGQRQMQFGEQDFTIDLQQALIAVDESKKAYGKIDQGLRDKFPTWQKFVNAIATGEIAKEMQEQHEAKTKTRARDKIEEEISHTKAKENRLRDLEAEQVAERFRRGEPEQKPKSDPSQK